MAIFNLEHQKAQAIETSYHHKGYTYTNETHHCDVCNTETTQAVCVNTLVYGNQQIKVTKVQVYRDCLTCTNTFCDVISENRVNLERAS